MANYSDLLYAVRNAVNWDNGNHEISGPDMLSILETIIGSLGAEYKFAGVATPESVIPVKDAPVFYLVGAGEYNNFGSQEVIIPDGTIGVFYKDSEWHYNTVSLSVADDSITSDKIADGAVTEDKIGAGAVTENKIGAGAVKTNKLGDASVSSQKIAGEAVTTAKIAGKAVTMPKLGDDVIEEFDKKANIDGFYSTLGAGVSENLVGRGSVPAEYTFRTSGGDADLGSGTAQIKRLMGRTLAFNQLMQNGNFESWQGWSFGSQFDGTISVANNTATLTVTGSKKTAQMIQYTTVVAGHKYYFASSVKPIVMASASTNAEFNGGAGNLTAIEDTISYKDIIAVDLTQMFGTGNEPSTVEEFESLFPLDYYAYNPGTLLSVNATGIKTVGFNQWDEEYEDGALDFTTGQKTASTTSIVSKNFIPVFPNTEYYRKNPENQGNSWMAFYDANYNYLGSDSWASFSGNGTFDTPANARYMLFYVPKASFNNDICINLSWSGYRNGEYEPYWESELPIPITTMTGKLNGAGASIAMFADGFKSAGNAFDEITAEKAMKRMKKINLGDLDWTWSANGYWYSENITDAKFYDSIEPQNIICSNRLPCLGYQAVGYASGHIGEIALYPIAATTYNIVVPSADSVNTPEGVLIYELATPEEYILDAEQPMNYRVDDFGTEMELPQNGDEPVTAPIRYDVQYAMNAVDTLRRLPENYISKESFEAFLAEFDSKLGVALDSTVTTTMTYDSDHQKYGFTITITPNA